MHSAFAELGPCEANVVDSSGLTVDRTLDEVLAGLRGGRFRL
jgi:hypothetical protein